MQSHYMNQYTLLVFFKPASSKMQETEPCYF